MSDPRASGNFRENRHAGFETSLFTALASSRVKLSTSFRSTHGRIAHYEALFSWPGVNVRRLKNFFEALPECDKFWKGHRLLNECAHSDVLGSLTITR